VLYWICSEENALEIVEHLLDYLSTADYNIKEDLVLKVAILAEKFGKDLTWYIDVVVQLITHAGNSISDEIWHRLIQVVTGFGETVS
jgi:AP-2 complex subunit alpha